MSASDEMLHFHHNPQPKSSKILLGSAIRILFTTLHEVLLKVVCPFKTLTFNKHLPSTSHRLCLIFSQGGKVATFPLSAEAYVRLFRLDIKP